MKIFGDESSTEFKNFATEPGALFGHNDVLKGSEKTVQSYTLSFWENSTSLKTKTFTPKLYLHIPTNPWTTFTGKLREYFLPWLWKTAYLDIDQRKILVCASVQEGKLSPHLSKLLGKSWFVTNLINNNLYDEIFGQDFIRLRGEGNQRTIKVAHPLGEKIGVHAEFTSDLLCHIYRPQSLFSTFKYTLLKQFSSSWKEVVIQVGRVSENVLIKKSDEEVLSRAGLIA